MKNQTFRQSLKCAWIGIGKGFRSEKNFKYYVVIALVMLAIDYYAGAVAWEYCVFLILTAAVFALEFVNTAIERIADLIEPQYSKAVADIKDIAATAVLICGIAFFAAQAVILVPKL